nr:MAG TPA: hypothetical protein [Caudoviricetes sp.]
MSFYFFLIFFIFTLINFYGDILNLLLPTLPLKVANTSL